VLLRCLVLPIGRRDVIGAEQIVDYTVHENLIQRLAERFGMAMGRGVATALRLPANGLQ